jgi:hypothetical protein
MRATLYLLILMLSLLQGCSKTQDAAAAQQHTERLAALKSGCQQTMLQNTCTAMNAERVKTAKPGDVVFVAGVGPVDAQLFESLQVAGENMCQEVAATCSLERWDSAACKALRAMYLPTRTSAAAGSSRVVDQSLNESPLALAHRRD